MAESLPARHLVASGLVAARRIAPLRAYVLFLVACTLAFLLELATEHFAGGSEAVARSVFDVRGIYQYVVTSWPRRLVPRYTVLVLLDTERDATAKGLAMNACEQRAYLAKLVPAIAAQEPAIIVLDKYFLASGCESEASNALLADALVTVSRRVPVIVGLHIDEHAVDGRPPYAVEPPVAFPVTPSLREGIVNIDVDSRRLALGWTVIPAPNAPAAWRNALALEAAEAYDPLLRTKFPMVEALVAARSHPYVSLIAAQEFRAFQAGDLVCPQSDLPPGLGRKCEGRPPAGDLGYLRGRIVMFGQVTPGMDWHPSLIGRVPGVVLQANYVEALLDERYFRPVPPWVDYLLGFVFFVAVEAALRGRRTHVCLARVAGIVVVTFLVLALTARHLGFYLNPISVSALYLMLKLIAWLSDRISHGGKESHAAT